MAAKQTDLVKLVKARSLLIVLLATTREARVALDGAAYDVRTDIVSDLERIAGYAEREIEGLNEAIVERS